MPLDKLSKPRGGLARMHFANRAHEPEPKGEAKGTEKGSKPAKMTAPPATPGKPEEHEADAGMHAHSHKGGEHDVSKTAIGDVVKEHGPATHIFSEHKDGGHHVHSVHGEKHHHSDHEDVAAAHEHMGSAMGTDQVESPDQDHLASPFEGEQTPTEEAMEDQVTAGKAHRGMGLG